MVATEYFCQALECFQYVISFTDDFPVKRVGVLCCPLLQMKKQGLREMKVSRHLGSNRTKMQTQAAPNFRAEG